MASAGERRMVDSYQQSTLILFGGIESIFQKRYLLITDRRVLVSTRAVRFEASSCIALRLIRARLQAARKGTPYNFQINTEKRPNQTLLVIGQLVVGLLLGGVAVSERAHSRSYGAVWRAFASWPRHILERRGCLALLAKK